MELFLSDSGGITFIDGNDLNRNSINRKVMTVSLESALTTAQSLWIQFGDDINFENLAANILEPIRLQEMSDGTYRTPFPEEVIKNPKQWFITFSIREYSIDGSTFITQLTSEKVSFTVNDSYPIPDDGYKWVYVMQILQGFYDYFHAYSVIVACCYNYFILVHVVQSISKCLLKHLQNQGCRILSQSTVLLYPDKEELRAERNL